MNEPAVAEEGSSSGWVEAFRRAGDPRVISIGCLGFAAGAPLLLVFSTLSIWLREAGVELGTITLFSWAALAYAFKFAWAPLIDTLPLPGLGRQLGQRRAWLLVAQLGILAALIAMARTDPSADLYGIAIAATALGFASASQDIVIDAYRIEIAPPAMQSLLSGAYIAGYRAGMLASGAGALSIAGLLEIQGFPNAGWHATYIVMAAVLLIGPITTLVVHEPPHEHRAGRDYAALDYVRFLLVCLLGLGAFLGVFLMGDGLKQAVTDTLADHLGMSSILAAFIGETVRFLIAVVTGVGLGFIAARLGAAPRELMQATYVAPFMEFLRRYGRAAFIILALIGLYRLSDIVLGAIANVFYTDVGFSKATIGWVSKAFGIGMTLVGGLLGGLLSARYGFMRILFLGAVLAAGTNVLFVALNEVGDALWLLIVVISADNIAGGIAVAAFITLLSNLTNRTFTASQYAIFSSLMLILPKLVAGYSGSMVEQIGYSNFFITTALMGLPIALLVLLIHKMRLVPT